jgi:phosphoesterase RecJ-like protein
MNNLKNVIEAANRILITSHIGPDGDSVSSSILLAKILKTNFDGKAVSVSMEEEAPSLAFIDGYDQIKFGPLADSLNEFKPDLMIVLDANTLKRVTRNAEVSSRSIRETGCKLAVIDHHEPDGKDNSDVYINQQSPAVAQDVYDIFIDQMKLAKPEGYAQIAIVGIYTDTGGFIYRNLDYKKTFDIVAKLLLDGADIETVVNQLNRLSSASLDIVGELIKNTATYSGATYSFIGDDLTNQKSGDLVETIRQGADIYRNVFLRNLDDRTWGFLVYRDLLADEPTYSVSLRALSDSKDVSLIAAALGGGGHKPAAGAKITCSSAEEAIAKVKEAIDSLK